MYRGYRQQGLIGMPVFSFVKAGVCKSEQGHMWKRTNGLGDR